MEHSPEDHRTAHAQKRRYDWLLIITSAAIVLGYILHLLFVGALGPTYAGTFTSSIYELINRMWWGIALGVLFVGLLDRVPRDLVNLALGQGNTLNGILRATAAGVLLDLCSHGILLVGMKLYERGVSLGQVMAFLIASPWNSLSLTIILVALIGLPWTLIFILLSIIIAIGSGILFNKLVNMGVLAENANAAELDTGMGFRRAVREELIPALKAPHLARDIVVNGITGSRMIMRWIFFGVVLASLVRTFMPPDMFQTAFGPTLAGLGLTLVVATIIEVCSEGSTPIAADILTRAGAPGNAFTFLMAGVSTDYTEMLSLKERTGSWKIAFFLPLVTLPQVLVLGWALNYFH